MRINIFLHGKLIGRGILDASDPPMGVATGPFKAAPSYRRDVHAGEIEGAHNPAGTDLPFTVQAGDGVLVECQSVFIRDYGEILGERQVSVLGIPYPEYEAWFGDHAAYKAYWDKS